MEIQLPNTLHLCSKCRIHITLSAEEEKKILLWIWHWSKWQDKKKGGILLNDFGNVSKFYGYKNGALLASLLKV